MTTAGRGVRAGGQDARPAFVERLVLAADLDDDDLPLGSEWARGRPWTPSCHVPAHPPARRQARVTRSVCRCPTSPQLATAGKYG